MKCERVQGKLGTLLDGRLRGRAREEVEAHVAMCEGCREELEALRSLDEALAGEPAVEPPESMGNAIVRRTTARWLVRRRMWIPGWLEGLTFAGVGAAAGSLGVVALIVVGSADAGRLGAADAIGLVGVLVAAGLAVFGAAYYRA